MKVQKLWKFTSLGLLAVAFPVVTNAGSLDQLRPYCPDAADDNKLIQCGTARIRSYCQGVVSEVGRNEGTNNTATQHLGKAFFHADKCLKRSDVYSGNYSWLEALTNLNTAHSALAAAKSAGVKARSAKHDEGAEEIGADSVPLKKDPGEQLAAMKTFCNAQRATLATLASHPMWQKLEAAHRTIVEQAKATAAKRLDQCDNAIKQRWSAAVGMANEAASAVATVFRTLTSTQKREDKRANDAVRAALQTEFQRRERDFSTRSAAVHALVAQAEMCAPRKLVEVFPDGIVRLNARMCDPSKIAPAGMLASDARAKMDACFVGAERGLSEQVSQVKTVLDNSTWRDRAACAFNKNASKFLRDWEALEDSVKEFGKSASEFFHELAECASEASRLSGLGWKITDPALKKEYLSIATKLQKFAGKSIGFGLTNPVALWKECKEAIQAAGRVIKEAGNVVVAGSRVLDDVKETAVETAKNLATGAVAETKKLVLTGLKSVQRNLKDAWKAAKDLDCGKLVEIAGKYDPMTLLLGAVPALKTCAISARQGFICSIPDAVVELGKFTYEVGKAAWQNKGKCAAVTAGAGPFAPTALAMCGLYYYAEPKVRTLGRCLQQLFSADDLWAELKKIKKELFGAAKEDTDFRNALLKFVCNMLGSIALDVVLTIASEGGTLPSTISRWLAFALPAGTKLMPVIAKGAKGVELAKLVSAKRYAGLAAKILGKIRTMAPACQ